MNDEQYQKIKDIMISIGFSEKGADEQLNELGKIIQMSVIERVAQENKDSIKALTQDPESFIKKRYNKEELVSLTIEVAVKVTEDYIKEITKDLSPAQKSDFFKQLGLRTQQ